MKKWGDRGLFRGRMREAPMFSRTMGGRDVTIDKPRTRPIEDPNVLAAVRRFERESKNAIRRSSALQDDAEVISEFERLRPLLDAIKRAVASRHGR